MAFIYAGYHFISYINVMIRLALVYLMTVIIMSVQETFLLGVLWHPKSTAGLTNISGQTAQDGKYIKI